MPKNLILLFCLIFFCSSALAQKSITVSQEVKNRLNAIKPKNTKEIIYRVTPAPVSLLKLPKNLRLDIVYKDGHYRWDLAALRFERIDGKPFVKVSQIIFSSGFPFYQEAIKMNDSYSLKEGEMPIRDFDKLLALSNALYHSNIEKEPAAVKTAAPAKNRKFRVGAGFGSGEGSVSVTSSSGDGTILLQIADEKNHSVILSDSGKIHAGSLTRRLDYNFEYIRVHLFWEVFFEYVQSHPLGKNIETSQAVDLLISRLEEPPMVNDYKDYFRLSLYIELLGELGSRKAIPVLQSIEESNKLEENWRKSLKAVVNEAIEKIKSRN